jgi:hypothetical protein
MPFKQLVEKCIAMLEKLPDWRILQGMGEPIADKPGKLGWGECPF